jgi:hypothetical protein
LFIDITLPSEADKQDRTATISATVSEPAPAVLRKVARGKPLSGTELHGIGPVFDKAARTWTFRVHADCWDLVACRVSDPVACATAWAKGPSSGNWGIKCPSPASRTPACDAPPQPKDATTGLGRNYRRTSMQRLASFDGLAEDLALDRLPTVHDPISLEQLGLAHLHWTSGLTWPSRETDPFSVLPEESLEQIIEYIPTRDLLNLRLASKAIACISQLPRLPRSFWRSRFTPPHELGFALPERVDEDVDWRGIYFLIRQALREYCRIFSSRKPERRVMARLAKRCYWWERLKGVVEMYEEARRVRVLSQAVHEAG